MHKIKHDEHTSWKVVAETRAKFQMEANYDPLRQRCVYVQAKAGCTSGGGVRTRFVIGIVLVCAHVSGSLPPSFSS
jgi:hypothetical protein